MAVNTNGVQARAHLVGGLDVDVDEVINELVVDGLVVLRVRVGHAHIVHQHAHLQLCGMSDDLIPISRRADAIDNE